VGLQCVILAGGRGTRMECFTDKIPKALIPVQNKPFIDYQLAHLAHTGVTDIILSVGYKGEQIRHHVKDGAAWNLHVRYVDEGDDLRGTGGALKLALDLGVLEPAFLITYGDALLPIDFLAVWRYFQSRTEPILMTVFKNADRWEKSNANFDGQKVVYDKRAKEKDPGRQFLDYGVLGFRREIVESDILAGRIDLADVLQQRSLQGDVAGMEVKNRAYQIGTPEGLKDLSHYLQQTHGAH
jgi:NDP-sugar pyrophosphorylase family protein